MTTDLGAAFTALARRLRAATVAVHDERGRGSGSGVVWDARGLVITNAHVVRGRSAVIELADGRRFRARVAAYDAERDLAALRVASTFGDGVVQAQVRDSATLVPGELVVAVGNPHGIAGAVATGLVHRSGPRWVVTDVKLAPGNSGGPLADAAGLVIGINSMIARGYGLAVPSTAVTAFLRAVHEGTHAA